MDSKRKRTIAILVGAYTGDEQGDTWIEAGPDHPDYESWLAYYEANPEADAEGKQILKEIRKVRRGD